MGEGIQNKYTKKIIHLRWNCKMTRVDQLKLCLLKTKMKTFSYSFGLAALVTVIR